ncbi:arylsulfatase B-like [Saccoglossus kowalevskii]
MYVCVFLGILAISVVHADLGTLRPHILFILADDLGWHDVGYHDSEIQTPNIDMLAAEGVKLENYYVTPLCTPSRAVLMTGRYLIHSGMQHGVLVAQNPRCLPTDEILLPQMLKDSGYSTHMVGKWHLGFCKFQCTPNHRGFDTFFGEVPMFIYLPFQAVHAPLQVPDKYSDMYKDTIHDESRRTYAGMTSCMDEAIGNITRTLKDKGIWNNTVIVFSTDNGGARTFGASNYPLRGQKASNFEGGIRGPAFVSSPLLDPLVRGTINNELMYIGDWFPTFMNLAGGHVIGSKPLDGINQWETISRGVPSKRVEIVYNIDPLWPGCKSSTRDTWIGNPYFDICVSAAIRVGHWKLLTGHTGCSNWETRPEIAPKSRTVESSDDGMVRLYHIKEDAEEKVNLVHYRPDIVFMLLQRLHYHNTTAVPPGEVDKFSVRADPARHGMAWNPWI